MKKIMFCLSMVCCFTVSVWSAVQIQVLDYSQRRVRLVYELDDNLAGNRTFRFPGSGFLHDNSRGPIVVESVYDQQTNQDLEYSVIALPDTGAPQIEIRYDKPVPEGGKKMIRVSMIAVMPPENIGRDTLGRYYFKYETSHKFEFIVPFGQYVVHTNQPVTVFERESRVYLRQEEGGAQEIYIMTRSM